MVAALQGKLYSSFGDYGPFTSATRKLACQPSRWSGAGWGAGGPAGYHVLKLSQKFS